MANDLDAATRARLAEIKRKARDPRYCEHTRYRGHHIECVSLIKRVRWFQCLDCGAVFAPTPLSD